MTRDALPAMLRRVVRRRSHLAAAVPDPQGSLDIAVCLVEVVEAGPVRGPAADAGRAASTYGTTERRTSSRRTRIKPARPRTQRWNGRTRLAGVARDERGSAAVELVLLVPMLVLILLLVVALGRFASARGLVDEAAHQAARAASLTRSAPAAEQAAYQAAHAALDGAGVTCTSLAVTVDTGGFAPGGRVRVAVSCTVSLAEMSALGLPGHRTLEGKASSILDEYRGIA